jgi:hypothetical protein
LPLDATCTFNPASVTPRGAAATSTLTIASNVKTASNSLRPQMPFPQTNSGPKPRYQMMISTASLLVICGFGFMSRKARRNWARYLGLIAFLAMVAGTATGCGAKGSTKTPPGQYSVTVTGTSGSLTHSVTYSITVQ